MTEGCLTSLFFEDPPILPTHHFSNYVHPTGTHMRTHTHNTHTHTHTHTLIWIYTCCALVPQYKKDLDVCFMQQGIKFTEVWHMWFFTGALIWYYTHPQHSTAQHTQGPVDWHPYKYLYTTYVLTAAIYYINKWLNDIKNLLYIMSFLFNYSSLVSHVCWLDAIRLGSPCKTEITLKMV